MVQGLTTRKLAVNEVHLIQSLAQVIWESAYKNILTREQIDYMLNLFYAPAALEEQINTKGHEFLLLEWNSNPVAFASFGVLPEPGVFKLHKLYVSEKLQGKGVGKLLLEEISRSVLKKGGTILELNVNRNNKAKGFYEKLGFHVIREEDIDIGNGYFMHDYVMRKQLSQL